MNNTPLLTIITVTFNAERFLERTLRSVRAALVKSNRQAEVEYLIIDGASSDNTLLICENYKGIISNVISEKDHGLYDAMNKGIRLATGKYLWFLNAGDEIFDEDVISELLNAFKSGSGVYYSDAMMVDESGKERGLRSEFTPHDLPTNVKWTDFALGMKVCHQAFIAEKSIVPFYQTNNLSADIEWEISCLKSARRAQFVPFVLCRYLLGGASVQNHRRSLINRFSVLSKHFGFFPTILNHFRIIARGISFAVNRGRYW